VVAFSVALELGDSNLPVYRRIADAIAHEITRGRLRPGEKLSSSRVLATQLEVNRNTVIAAYDELRAHGWIAAEPGRGVFIVGVPPAVRAAPAPERPRAPGFALADEFAGEIPMPRTPGMLLLLGGVPELRFLPVRQLAGAYRAALQSAVARRLVDYGDPQGQERLRVALGQMLSRLRGIPAATDSIAVVRGSQHGIYLAGQALLAPGDAVAVESLGYRPAWRALELAGATLTPIPVDAEGLDVAALERACARRPIRAVYLTPHHQYPTTVTLSPERRRRLLELARRERMVVLEDDYDYDFHYDGRPVLPLASGDTAGVVVYLGTLSKCLAPGLRVGYVVAAPDVVRRIVAYRSYVDVQGDHAMEHAVATLLEEGDVERHVRRALRAYRSRRDALCAALARHVPSLEATAPSGGMALWARAPGIDTEAWVMRGRAEGVAFQAGRRFTLDGSALDHVRVGFAACDERELEEAARRMARALAT
jgi:GntR family transcriptional regulator / MocR family aminotransferase